MRRHACTKECGRGRPRTVEHFDVGKAADALSDQRGDADQRIEA